MIKMNVIKTNIEGVLIIEPRLFRDARGYFFESFSEREFKEKVDWYFISEYQHLSKEFRREFQDRLC